MQRFAGAALLAVCCLAVFACGSSGKKAVHPVRGQVFFNKKPAHEAVVILHPLEDGDAEKWPQGLPRGTVDEAGAFRITTYDADDGAPAGEYAVTIHWLVRDPDEVDLLAGRYADPKNPKFRIKVHEGDNVVDPFHVK